MYQITIQSIVLLIAKVKGIVLPIDECLLPFGCKLCKVNSNYYIKHYAYDQSDLKQLIDRFPFLKNPKPNPLYNI